MMRRRGSLLLGAMAILAIVLLACAPAATPTPVPPRPTPLKAAATPTPAQATPTPARAGPTPVPTTPTPTRVAPTPVAAAITPTAAPPTAGEPKYGGTMVLALEAQEEKDFNPAGIQLANWAISRWLSFVQERAIAWPNTGCVYEPIPNLVEKWEWLNDTTLVFHLRQGVRFQNRPPINGREVDAYDLANSIEKIATTYAKAKTMIWAKIKSIEVKDKYTVVINLHNPSSTLLFALSQPWVSVFPREGSDPKWNWSDSKFIIGAGPYLWKEWALGTRAVFERNPDYWRKDSQGRRLPFIDSVVYLVMPDEGTRLAAIRTKKVDMVFYAGNRERAEIRKTNPELVISECDEDTGRSIFMNTDKGPFADPRVRLAVSLGIDRDAYKKLWSIRGPKIAFLSNWAFGYIPPEQLPLPARKIIEYNPEEAKKLLKEAGYEKGFNTQLNWYTKYGTEEMEVAEFLADQLAKIGIKATLNTYSTSAELAYWTSFKYTESPVITLWGNEGKAREVGISLETTLHPSGTRNASKVNDPYLTKLIEEQERALDPAKRRKIIEEIQIYLAEKVYAFTLPGGHIGSIAQPWVKNFVHTGHQSDVISNLMYAWVEK